MRFLHISLILAIISSSVLFGMDKNIIELPSEIITHIAALCPNKDNLRLTCKKFADIASIHNIKTLVQYPEIAIPNIDEIATKFYTHYYESKMDTEPHLVKEFEALLEAGQKIKSCECEITNLIHFLYVIPHARIDK